MEQLTDVLAGAAVELSDDVLDALDADRGAGRHAQRSRRRLDRRRRSPSRSAAAGPSAAAPPWLSRWTVLTSHAEHRKSPDRGMVRRSPEADD